MGDMAVIAGGGRPVARAQPGFVLLFHDMAVGAGNRIVTKIRNSMGVKKGIKAEPRETSHTETDQKRQANPNLCVLLFPFQNILMELNFGDFPFDGNLSD